MTSLWARRCWFFYDSITSICLKVEIMKTQLKLRNHQQTKQTLIIHPPTEVFAFSKHKKTFSLIDWRAWTFFYVISRWHDESAARPQVDWTSSIIISFIKPASGWKNISHQTGTRCTSQKPLEQSIFRFHSRFQFDVDVFRCKAIAISPHNGLRFFGYCSRCCLWEMFVDLRVVNTRSLSRQKRLVQRKKLEVGTVTASRFPQQICAQPTFHRNIVFVIFFLHFFVE